ncbi:hypothetical protein OIU85_003981 [Salix viminalis]|uniref:Uncharacterized protein n=1 Tax=Salix viminalis TaxID=40686 RepID=A0A9Q0PSD7_SALVM|nr:hypothetical protein OIU85_003981 [Salix viminalis]
MHQVGPCSKHILLTGLDQLPMGIIRHRLHLAKAILSKVASLLQHTGQPGGQAAAGYGQVPAGAYAGYPSSQGYPEQQAANNAGYGYQVAQDPAYGSAPAFSAPTSQQAYAQPAPTQPAYDQSVPQSAAYGAAPATAAPVGYAKTVSPQPGFPQYDSTQMYTR